jgi:hypothetical protein
LRRERGKRKRLPVVLMGIVFWMRGSSVSARLMEKMSLLAHLEELLVLGQGVPWYCDSSALTMNSPYSSLSR